MKDLLSLTAIIFMFYCMVMLDRAVRALEILATPIGGA